MLTLKIMAISGTHIRIRNREVACGQAARARRTRVRPAGDLRDLQLHHPESHGFRRHRAGHRGAEKGMVPRARPEPAPLVGGRSGREGYRLAFAGGLLRRPAYHATAEVGIYVKDGYRGAG